jgi:hypothetical protein
MKSFQAFLYWRDPLCLAGCACYALNRWALKPVLDWRFLHSHFNDLLLIPCALPIGLWLQRHLNLRRHNGWPSSGEILFHLILWALVCEWLGPYLMHQVTGDPLDVIAYAAGALAAWLWWTRQARRGPNPD